MFILSRKSERKYPVLCCSCRCEFIRTVDVRINSNLHDVYGTAMIVELLLKPFPALCRIYQARVPGFPHTSVIASQGLACLAFFLFKIVFQYGCAVAQVHLWDKEVIFRMA